MSKYICEECAHLKWELLKQQSKNAELLGQIEGLKDALIMQRTLVTGDLLKEGERFKVIKVKNITHRNGFTSIEDNEI